jgi:hypothetical protein
VQGQWALAAQRAAHAQQQQAVDPQTQRVANRPNVNPLQALPLNQRRKTPGATEPTVTGKTLSELLCEDMAAEGISDADIAASVG